MCQQNVGNLPSLSLLCHALSIEYFQNCFAFQIFVGNWTYVTKGNRCFENEQWKVDMWKWWSWFRQIDRCAQSKPYCKSWYFFLAVGVYHHFTRAAASCCALYSVLLFCMNIGSSNLYLFLIVIFCRCVVTKSTLKYKEHHRKILGSLSSCCIGQEKALIWAAAPGEIFSI
jgi:hypothetical protein